MGILIPNCCHLPFRSSGEVASAAAAAITGRGALQRVADSRPSTDRVTVRISACPAWRFSTKGKCDAAHKWDRNSGGFLIWESGRDDQNGVESLFYRAVRNALERMTTGESVEFVTPENGWLRVDADLMRNLCADLRQSSSAGGGSHGLAIQRALLVRFRLEVYVGGGQFFAIP